MKKDLTKIVEKFKDKRIAVIGDLMLDTFIFGDTDRISPEAPVPVVLVSHEIDVPGGAGNVANNIISLGGNACVFGLLGEDIAGNKLFDYFQKNNIDISGIIKDKNRYTIQKSRVISRSQHVVRIDREVNKHIENHIEKELFNKLKDRIKEWDIIVIADYMKGLLTGNLITNIINLARKFKKLTIADTKPKHAAFFKNIYLLTPNKKEAQEMSGVEHIKKSGRKIQKKLSCNVLITQGADGMTLFKSDKILHIPSKAKEVYDVSGAGDTVSAVLALSLASGATLEESSIIANHAAGIVVGKTGTATLSKEELINDLKNNK